MFRARNAETRKERKDKSAREAADKSAAFAVNRPRYAKIRSLVLVEFGDRRHRVRHLSERLIVDIFVAAQVVLTSDCTSLYSGKLSSLHQSLAVVTVVAGHFNPYRSEVDSHNIIEQLAGHRLRELQQRLLLFRTCSLVDDDDRPGRVWVVVQIA